MTDELPPVESEDAAMLTCPWYQLHAKCDMGCWTEPRCEVNMPLEGWKWRDAKGRFAKTPTKEVLRAIATRRSWAEKRRHPELYSEENL